MNALTRELRADEREQLLAHLLALEPEARRLRFANAMSDDSLRQYVDRIDFSRDAVFVVTDDDLAIVGAAHLSRSDEHAELGISVLPQARGRGIGAALLDRSATRARNWGMCVLFMNCLAENAAMMHLARKQGLQVAVSSGEAEAFVRLPRASLTSLAAEAIAEQIGLLDHAQKSHWQALRGLWLTSARPSGQGRTRTRCARRHNGLDRIEPGVPAARAEHPRKEAMLLENLPIGNDPPREVNVVIEVPIGDEPIKYELDKAADMLVVDRFLYTPMRYPGNYGFIPHTLSEDGDPCDVLVANTRPLMPGSAIAVRPVGVLRMTDEAGGDEKIVAVPTTKLTQRYDHVQNYTDLPEIVWKQVEHFFSHYKDLEPGKWVKFDGWGDADEAQAMITRAIARAASAKGNTRS